jgi:cytochrome c oxidase subunit 2
MQRFERLLGFLTFLMILLAPAVRAAKPEAWQIYFQEAVTPVMEKIVHLHNILLVIIFAIGLFVLCVLFYIVWRFNARRQAVPSRTTHNTLLEIVWTAIPATIVLVVMIPSVKLLYFMDKVEQADLTIKIVGRQWYWHYAYPDKGYEFEFDSVMIPTKDLKAGQLRLLEVDHPLVVPVNTNIRLLFTADDVLHSWTVPAFGVKQDTVPGRLKETWIRVTKEGTYYGQCSELCGAGHGYMPIQVNVVSKAEFETWLASAKKKFAQVSGDSLHQRGHRGRLLVADWPSLNLIACDTIDWDNMNVALHNLHLNTRLIQD